MTLNGSPVPINVSDADTIDAIVTHTPTSDLPQGKNDVSVSVTDNAGRSNQKSWSFFINLTSPFFLNVHTPEDLIYNTRRVPFNLTTTAEVERIEYINFADRRPRFRSLCRNCDEFGFDRRRTKTLRDGQNNLTIKATDEHGNTREKNISLFIDRKDPNIRKTRPTRGFASGFFEVEFREENPISLYLNYGNDSTSLSQKLNITSCIQDRRDTICNVTVDLSQFDLQEIFYFFNITDIAGNFDESRTRELDVDLTPPIINNFTATPVRRRMEFIFNVTEENFDEINYIDFTESRPREKRLCSRLRDDICEKKKSFRRGDHNLTITAYDDAGNSALITKDFLFTFV